MNVNQSFSFDENLSKSTPFVNGNSSRNPYLLRLDKFTRSLLSNYNYNLLSIFSGGGGLDLGLNFAGFKSLVVNDIEPTNIKTLVKNFPEAIPVSEDIASISIEKLLHLTSGHEIDLVAAGPPCQSFSVLGKRGALDDPRGRLVLKYFDLVAGIRPRAFLLETVPGILTVNKGVDWEYLLNYASEKIGYKLKWTILNSVSFGVPQFRSRVFLVGFREATNFDFPSTLSGANGKPLLDNAHFNVPSGWAFDCVEDLPNHEMRKHGRAVVERYASVPPGGRDKVDHTDRIDPDRPSNTIVVGSSEGGGRPMIHPYEPRVITVREAARIQSFPDWYVFEGNNTSQYRQVGNAVPPLFSYAIGRKIIEAFDGSSC